MAEVIALHDVLPPRLASRHVLRDSLRSEQAQESLVRLRELSFVGLQVQGQERAAEAVADPHPSLEICDGSAVVSIDDLGHGRGESQRCSADVDGGVRLEVSEVAGDLSEQGLHAGAGRHWPHLVHCIGRNERHGELQNLEPFLVNLLGLSQLIRSHWYHHALEHGRDVVCLSRVLKSNNNTKAFHQRLSIALRYVRAALQLGCQC